MYKTKEPSGLWVIEDCLKQNEGKSITLLAVGGGGIILLKFKGMKRGTATIFHNGYLEKLKMGN